MFIKKKKEVLRCFIVIFLLKLIFQFNEYKFCMQMVDVKIKINNKVWKRNLKNMRDIKVRKYDND